MANQRAEGKRLIGAQASAELWAAVDQWLGRNPNKTVTDFVLSACLEKLVGEGIEIDRVGALRDRRGRLPAPINPEPNPNYRKGIAPLKISSTAAEVRDQIYAGAGRKISRRKPSKKSSVAKHPVPVAPSKS